MQSRTSLPVARFDLRVPAVWAVPLAALACLAVLLLTGTNQSVFLQLNRIGPLTSDSLWAMITVLGDTLVALAVALVLWRRRPDLVWALLIAIPLAAAWVHGLGALVKERRPPAVLGEAVHVIGHAYKKRSFPSGHTTTAFLAAGLLTLGLSPRARRAAPAPAARDARDEGTGSRLAPGEAHARWVTLLASTLAVLAGVSRAVVGVHWPVDIAAGALGGWLCAVLGLEAARRSLAFGTSAWVQRLAGLFFAGCAIALAAGHASGYVQAYPLQRLIGVACLASAALVLWRTRAKAAAHDADARIGPN